MKKITIGLANDHLAVKLGVAHAMSGLSDGTFAFGKEEMEQIFKNLVRIPIEVVLCDSEDKAGDASCLDVYETTRQVHLGEKILIVCSCAQYGLANPYQCVDATRYVRKRFSNLSEALGAVKQGVVYLPSSIASELIAKVFD